MLLKDRMAKAMELAGLDNQSELARACGVRPSAINMILSGATRNISADLLYKAARILSVNAEWLGVGAGLPRPVKLDHTPADDAPPANLSLVEHRRPPPRHLTKPEHLVIDGYRLADESGKEGIMALAAIWIAKKGHNRRDEKNG
jgi:transcriptional regulator with XRE-family HTH domain